MIRHVVGLEVIAADKICGIPGEECDFIYLDNEMGYPICFRFEETLVVGGDGIRRCKGCIKEYGDGK